MSSIKPIKLYSHAQGPNPWKVVNIFEELSIPYTTEMVDFSKIKEEPFISVNPNGRVPAIEDPNTGVTLWESGAIVSYLVETYDKDHKISYGSSPEKFHEKQWADFQMSGQGPYYGQAVWFTRFHHEQLPSAKERYIKEIERVISVIDLHLGRTKQEYLVGSKVSYADLMFLPWAGIAGMFDPEKKWDEKYPHYTKWLATLNARPAVKKTFEDKAKAVAAASH